MDDKTIDCVADMVTKFINRIILAADDLGYDRDSFVSAIADMFKFMTEISTFENFEVHNTNGDRIRAMRNWQDFC